MFGYTERLGGAHSRAHLRAHSRRGRKGSQLVYSPPAGRFRLGGLVAVGLLVALLQVGIFGYVFGRLGISSGVAVTLLLVSLIGSMVNLPVARFRNQLVQVRRTVSVSGVRYIGPMLTRRSTTIAVNVGGALVPAIVSGYLIAHDRIGWQALVAVVVVGALVHLVARPVPGLGIAVPALLPGVFAALVAVALYAMAGHPVAVAGLAYAGGTLGTLLGADLVNLPKVRRLGAPVVSIGGAGTFDGVFITGIVAVLLASLL
jgi:uncharacterized membrane protein